MVFGNVGVANLLALLDGSAIYDAYCMKISNLTSNLTSMQHPFLYQICKFILKLRDFCLQKHMNKSASDFDFIILLLERV